MREREKGERKKRRDHFVVILTSFLFWLGGIEETRGVDWEKGKESTTHWKLCCNRYQHVYISKSGWYWTRECWSLLLAISASKFVQRCITSLLHLFVTPNLTFCWTSTLSCDIRLAEHNKLDENRRKFSDFFVHAKCQSVETRIEKGWRSNRFHEKVNNGKVKEKIKR